MREFQTFYQRHIGAALTVSVILHLALVAGLMAIWSSVWTQEPHVTVRLFPYMGRHVTFVQPAASETKRPGGSPMIPPPMKPDPPLPVLAGMPVPVPDRPDNITTTVGPAAPEPPAEGTGGIGGSGQGVGRIRGQGDGGQHEDIPPPVPPGDVQPRLLKKVEPVYPRLAKLAGVEGLVVLSLLVDEAGNAVEAKVVKSLGNTGCDEAAVAAALQWKFAPALRQGKPVSVRITAPILFTLRNAR